MKVTAAMRNTKAKITGALDKAWASLISALSRLLLLIGFLAVFVHVSRWVGLNIPYLAGLPATRLGYLDLVGGVVAIAVILYARRFA